MSTAGNVVFAGSYEGYFYALDAESGKELWHIYLGGAGGGAPNRFSKTHLPRKTTDVRFAYEVIVSRLAWPSSPCRRSSLRSTRRNRLP